MKVGELRTKLSALKKEEIIKLAVEFYKLVPKAKKEDYDLDRLINNPTKPRTNTKSSKLLSLTELEQEIRTFIEHVKADYYINPNNVVPKNERSKWRFKVKRWYKELINTKRVDADIKKQGILLSDLYELICESCSYQYFTTYDSFQSIGIEQTTFYNAVLILLYDSQGKRDALKKAIELIIDCPVSRYCLLEYFMKILIGTLDLSQLKEEGIAIVKQLISEHAYKPDKTKFYSSGNYRKEEKHNDLVKLGYYFYSSLFEVEEGIQFFQTNYYERDEEIKLYVLVCLLLEEKRNKLIQKVIEEGIANGIKPRENLLEVLEKIKKEG